MEFPNALEGFVEKAVCRDDADGVYTLPKQMCNVIDVVPKNFVVLADGGNEFVLRHGLPVDIHLAKAGGLDQELCRGKFLFYSTLTSKKR